MVQKLGKPGTGGGLCACFATTEPVGDAASVAFIETALGQSRYLILLASPEAARYPWIAKEVGYWLEHKSPDRLFIGLTDGELAGTGQPIKSRQLTSLTNNAYSTLGGNRMRTQVTVYLAPDRKAWLKRYAQKQGFKELRVNSLVDRARAQCEVA